MALMLREEANGYQGQQGAQVCDKYLWFVRLGLAGKLFQVALNRDIPMQGNGTCFPRVREGSKNVLTGSLAPENKAFILGTRMANAVVRRGSRLPFRLEIESRCETRRTTKTKHNIWNRTSK